MILEDEISHVFSHIDVVDFSQPVKPKLNIQGKLILVKIRHLDNKEASDVNFS